MKNKGILLLVLIGFVSCATKSVTVSEDLSAAEMVQRAQEASDRNRYKVSLQYYETILERFPWDSEYVCTAEYEIAFIHYKQKKYEAAKTEFNALLERYNSPDEELLPQQFKILSKKILDNISDIENRGKKAPRTTE